MEKLFTVPLKLNEMYLRGNAARNDKRIMLEGGAFLSTDTYFGCFPCEPYKRNVNIKTVTACARISGKGTIRLMLQSQEGDKTVGRENYDTSAPEKISLSSPLKNGCFYIRVDAQERTEIRELWYESAEGKKETDIAIIICTYKREENVLRNLRLLSSTISEDELLKDHMQVFCVDNGGTLSEERNDCAVPKGVDLIRNRNYGGSGGYARGMLEAVSSDRKITHLWLMDDDICFDASILRRAMTFLTHRKNDDVRLAAGMFPFGQPSVQHEASAVFNGYTFRSCCSGLDFRDRKALLKNRAGKYDNAYGGWWSLIIPVSEQLEHPADLDDRSILPMPFFIKLDDVEYGLRLPGPYVVMNGFGVWHEAFGKKANAWSEYYTTRNTLIIQAMYPALPHSILKTMGIRFLKALAYGEPKCMEAALKGAEHYAAGPEAFRKADPEARHREILARYRAPLRQDMNRKKMLQSAFRNLPRAVSRKSLILFIRSVFLLVEARLRPGPDQEGWKIMNTPAFWRDYLGIDKERQSEANGKQEEAGTDLCDHTGI